MKLRKMVALGMACAMTLSCSATAFAAVKGANEDPANTETTDETLRIALASEPSTLWPAGSGKTENEAQIISGCVLDTLVAKDHTTGEVIPNLATEWEWTDGTHCTFTLRDDVTMSDGSPLVADDVVYSVNDIWVALNAGNDTGRFITGATAEDDQTVTIEFAMQAPDMLEMLSMTNFGIVSQEEVEAVGGPEEVAKAPTVGCGKYKFVEWQSGQSITLTRNDEYWNPDYKGYFKDITFTFTNDAAAREMAVESGDVDVAYDMPVVQAATFAESENVQTIIHTFGQVAHLWYNMTEGHATADANVRKAIDMALDFDALAQVGTGGFNTQSLGYFTPDNKYYNETYTAEERAVDVEGAKALLEEAGYGDGLELSIVGMQDTAPLYTVIQENLRAIGINLTINTVDTAQFVEDAGGGNYDLIMVGEYTEARYPTLFCFLDQETIDTFVIGGPKTTTPEIDSLISEIIENPDEEAAKEQIGELEQMMKDQSIVSNLYPETKAAIISNDLKGYTTFERGFINPTNFYK